MTAVTEGDGPEEPETFGAFAARIGKSRPYVSKLKANGVITARALTPDGKLIPRLALEDIEANTLRGTRHAAAPAEASDATYARQRARKTAAEAERAEIELRARKGELVERATIAATLGPWIRELRDSIQAAPRDTVLDPVQAADCEAALAAALTHFSGRLAGLAMETPTDGAAAAGG
jgi:hypothetical protein